MITCGCGTVLEDRNRVCPSCGKDWRQVAHPNWGLWIGFGVLLTLAAIVITPNFIRGGNRGSLTSCESNLKNIGTALEMYSTDNKGLYPFSLRLLLPNYLKVIPTCPTAGRDTYSGSYAHRAKPDGYSYYCEGTNHGGVGISPNFPQYNSDQGLVTGH